MCSLGYFRSGTYFHNSLLSSEIAALQAELSNQERTSASYLNRIEQLSSSRNQEIADIRKDYEYKLTNLKATSDLVSTSLRLENIKLMNTAISDLNARSELIESVMDTIGVEIIKDGKEDPANTGGPFIPIKETAYEDLMKTVDDYLNTIKYLPLGRPVDGAITSKFGNRSDPLNKKKGIHEGVDIRGERGDKVCATAAGKVVKAFTNGGYGNYVEIDHGNGYQTVYAHMQNYLVKEGEPVEQGQVIGQVGSSGRSTGPHLHYEIRLDENPLDPQKYMKIADLSHTITVGHE
jgi:murein DD-endopeptidase MepM/ murein hydrolase activator NlpD